MRAQLADSLAISRDLIDHGGRRAAGRAAERRPFWTSCSPQALICVSMAVAPIHEVDRVGARVAPGLLLPQLGHRIVHNVIHAQIENRDYPGGILNLREGLDLARLIADAGPAFDWNGLASEACEGGYFRHLSGLLDGPHRTLHSRFRPPFADDLGSGCMAPRCGRQRRFPRASRAVPA
jgi:hypothetical protein